MNKRLSLLLLASLFLVACCSTETTDAPPWDPAVPSPFPPPYEQVEPTEPNEPAKPPKLDKDVMPPDYKSDSETWGNTGRNITIHGCEEWKRRDPGADC